MSCAREGCTCTVGTARYEVDGAVYCCEKCATTCTDNHCVCTSDDCETS